jgi:hypothetical protein
MRFDSAEEEAIIMNSLAGGHASRFKASPEGMSVIVKLTNQYEIEAYEKIFSKDESDPRYFANMIF